MIFHFQRLSNYPSIFPKYFDTLLIPFQNKFLESSFKMKNEDVSIHVEIFEKSEEAFSILDRSCTHTHIHVHDGSASWKIEADCWLRGDPVRPPSSPSPHKGIINASQSRCGAERIASIKCNFGRVSDTKFWIAPPPGYFHLNGEREDFGREISKARIPLFSKTTRRKNRPIFG